MHPSILYVNIHTHTHTNGQHRGPSSPHMLVFGLWEGAEVPWKNPGRHRKNIQPPRKKVQPVCREPTVPVTALLCHPESIDLCLFHPFCKEHHNSTNICPSPLLSWIPNLWQPHQLPPEDRSLLAYNHWEYLTSQFQFLVLDSSSYSIWHFVFSRAFLKNSFFKITAALFLFPSKFCIIIFFYLSTFILLNFVNPPFQSLKSFLSVLDSSLS